MNCDFVKSLTAEQKAELIHETSDILWKNNELSSLEFFCEILRAAKDDETKHKAFHIMFNRDKPKSEDYYGVLQAIKDITFGLEPDKKYKETAEDFLADPELYWNKL